MFGRAEANGSTAAWAEPQGQGFRSGLGCSVPGPAGEQIRRRLLQGPKHPPCPSSRVALSGLDKETQKVEGLFVHCVTEASPPSATGKASRLSQVHSVKMNERIYPGNLQMLHSKMFI